MTWKMFLDDERFPDVLYDDFESVDWVIVRSFQDAKWHVLNRGLPSFISFDHDLGSHTWTGMDFAKWFCDHVMDNDLSLEGFDFHVHSQNPVGAENIKSYMTQFLKDY